MNEAFGFDGEKLPLTSNTVQEVASAIFDNGDLLLVVSALGDSIGVNVIGPPSRKTYEALKATMEVYKKIIEDKGL